MDSTCQPSRRPSPCGIVCDTCTHLTRGCAGCAKGGGDVSCILRDCTRQKSLSGCWACGEFPCPHFQHLDPAWQGVNLGLVEAMRELGEERFVALALQNIGLHIDYGDLRFRPADEIRQLIKGTDSADGVDAAHGTDGAAH